MHDGMPYGRIQDQGQGHEPIQGSRIQNLQSREVDRQSPTGLIFAFYICCFVHVNKHIIYLWCGEGSNSSFECRIRSRDPGHAHLRVILWSAHRRGASSMSVPNLNWIALFVQKLLGSQNFEIGSRDPGHAHLGVVLWSARSRGLSSMSVPNLKQISLFVRKL